MYALGRGGSRRSINIWPGFVDGLATLLLVVIFVLMVFMVAQFFLSVAITGKDEALTRLESEINELAQLLALERSANTELRLNVQQLSAELQSSLASRESLSGQLATLTEERESLANQLAALADERDRLAALLTEEQSERERLASVAASSEEELAAARAELQQNRQALSQAETALADKRDELNAALARLEVEQKKLEEALAAIAAGKAELEDAYSTIEVDKEKIEAQLAELAILKSLRDDLVEKLQSSEGALEKERAALAEQKQLSEEAQLQVTLLNRQLAALREQLAQVADALEISEAKNKEQEVQIADLGKRLNVALASKVQELARYRSEFFGRLREALGNRQDIRIVGDRFVFQSEILFASGQATIGGEGQRQLAQLAATLKEIASTIPGELDWVLRVDGHTDRAPISTSAFPSNWELSTARAVSVVKFLIAQGIPPERLAATGFGEFQPLDPGGDEIAYRRNRRIEFKLTQR
ncbi:peptidoglycan -binding protein [Pelagibius marinus]|uniref:peptidoglycan -binding protein n=1 Tax=Pelagibius marinus TaxID=2762760 RepID=UPI001872772F|nr:peptidoglycan -binding protein [Pelagibius marinus]